MKIMAFTVFTGGVLLSLVPRYSWAGANEGREHFDERLQDKIFKQLNLTEEQEKQIKEIQKASKEKRKALNDNRKKAAENWKQAIEDTASEEGRLREAYQAIQVVKAEASQNRFEAMLAVRKVLQPEQRKKLQEIMKEMFSGKERYKFRFREEKHESREKEEN